MLTIIHFASREQIDGLRQLFTAPKRVVFNWPMADGTTQPEEMEWVTPKWVDVMDGFVIDTYPGGFHRGRQDVTSPVTLRGIAYYGGLSHGVSRVTGVNHGF